MMDFIRSGDITYHGDKVGTGSLVMGKVAVNGRSNHVDGRFIDFSRLAKLLWARKIRDES